MGDDSISRNERNEYLFHHLVAMFQTLALQQLGKLVNPITGQMERDLQQAKITIDMLQMIKDRTAGNLEQSERMILDRALLELQMNYVDENARGDDVPQEPDDESGSETPEDNGIETGRPAGGEEGNTGDTPGESEGIDAEDPETDEKRAKASGKKSSRKKKPE